MPNFTISVTNTQLAKLQAVVATHNANTGQTITVKQWLHLHLQELAIADDLNAAMRSLQEQQEKDAQTALNTAINTARDELLAAL